MISLSDTFGILPLEELKTYHKIADEHNERMRELDYMFMKESGMYIDENGKVYDGGSEK